MKSPSTSASTPSCSPKSAHPRRSACKGVDNGRARFGAIRKRAAPARYPHPPSRRQTKGDIPNLHGEGTFLFCVDRRVAGSPPEKNPPARLIQRPPPYLHPTRCTQMYHFTYIPHTASRPHSTPSA